MSPAEKAKAKVAIYEKQLAAMQDHVFFVQDEDGCLRRWYPPKPLLDMAAYEGEQK